MRSASKRVMVAGVALVAGCATGGSGPPDRWRSEVGLASFQVIEEVRVGVWERLGITVRQLERASRSFLVESEWVMRSPSAAQAARGLLETRVRYRLMGERDRAAEDDPRFLVALEVRHEIRTERVPEWHPHAIPGAVIDETRSQVDQLRAGLRAAVNRPVPPPPDGGRTDSGPGP